MLCLWVYCSHLPSVPSNRNLSEPRENFHQSSGFEECLEFQLLVFQWVWSHFDDDDEAVCRLARDPDEGVCSNLFSGQPRSHILRCPQFVVLFAVLFVDCEEWFCILHGSLPGARRAIVCLLFSLMQSQVVD